MLELAAVFAIAFGYLLGSIPFGLLLTRRAGLGDIRAVGSGNIGATNVLRTGHKGLAVATLVCDMLKGTLAVVVISYFFGEGVAVFAGFGAFFGHLFPVWLNFKGGKGVAVYIGILLGFAAWLALFTFAIVWLAVARLTRYSSLAALLASAVTPVILWARGGGPLLVLFAVLTITLWITHRANIARLAAGTETKIGSRSQAPPGEH
jgi:glycerol-3-phosphate acyltransferase PlsY